MHEQTPDFPRPDAAVILACASLAAQVAAARKVAGARHPARFLDRRLHLDPPRMGREIAAVLAELPEDVDTVLAALGWCGGAWEGLRTPKRLVLPRVDDCVSLLLTTDHEPRFDRKERGVLYVKDRNPGRHSFRRAFAGWTRDMDAEARRRELALWREHCRAVAVIETGLFDCRAPEYVAAARGDADWLHAPLRFVSGGNLLLEKLLSGRWDGQFAVFAPGEVLTRDRCRPGDDIA